VDHLYVDVLLSLPRSAWERTLATLSVASGFRAGRDAERPDVRSHAERGNEGESCQTNVKKFTEFYLT
jgi:hypothetical protein